MSLAVEDKFTAREFCLSKRPPIWRAFLFQHQKPSLFLYWFARTTQKTYISLNFLDFLLSDRVAPLCRNLMCLPRGRSGVQTPPGVSRPVWPYLPNLIFEKSGQYFCEKSGQNQGTFSPDLGEFWARGKVNVGFFRHETDIFSVGNFFWPSLADSRAAVETSTAQTRVTAKFDRGHKLGICEFGNGLKKTFQCSTQHAILCTLNSSWCTIEMCLHYPISSIDNNFRMTMSLKIYLI